MADSVSSASLDMEEEHLLDSIFAMDNTEVKLVSTCSVDRGVHDIGYPKGACCCIWCCRTPLGLLRNHSADGLCSFGKPAFLDWPDKVMTALSAPEFSRQDGKMRRCIVSCPTAMQMISLAPYCLSDSLLLFYIKKGLVPTPGLRQVSPFIANSVVFFELLTFFLIQFDTTVFVAHFIQLTCVSHHCKNTSGEYGFDEFSFLQALMLQITGRITVAEACAGAGTASYCMQLGLGWRCHAGSPPNCLWSSHWNLVIIVNCSAYAAYVRHCKLSLIDASSLCHYASLIMLMWKATFLALYQWQLLHLNPKVDGILYCVNVCWLTLG